MKNAIYPIDDVLRANLSTSVYGSLRESLATGRFKPDTRLRMRELAVQLGTSVTPVRDAILQLASEGALVLRSPRDIRVPALSVDRYFEIRAIRVELVGLAAATAAQCATPKAVAQLEEIANLYKDALARNDVAAALLYNQRFHLGLAEAAKMPTLQELIDRMWVRIAPLIAASYEKNADRSLIGDHSDVLAAIQRKDSVAARKAIVDCIYEGVDTIVACINEFETFDD